MSKKLKDTDRTTQLLELGSIGTIDTTRLSPSTISSMLSHVRLLRKNNVILTRSNLVGNVVQIIDSLRDSHGQLLNVQYKRQIIMTIKRLFPTDNIDATRYRETKLLRNKSRLSDDKFVSNIKRIVDRAALIVSNVDSNHKIDDLSMYDTCLCVLLTCVTSLRIHEIRELRMLHIDQMREGVPLSIHTKGNSSLRTVTFNDHLNSVLKAIERQRTYVLRNIRSREYDTNFTQKQKRRLNDDYIIITSTDFMRKKLREIAASLIIGPRILGFNVFRKYIVTVLVDQGGHLIAQSLNNHTNVNTTLDHYNVVSSSAAEKTYNSVGQKLIDKLVPHPKRPEPVNVKGVLSVVRDQEIHDQDYVYPNVAATTTEPSFIDTSRFQQQPLTPINEETDTEDMIVDTIDEPPVVTETPVAPVQQTYVPPSPFSDYGSMAGTPAVVSTPRRSISRRASEMAHDFMAMTPMTPSMYKDNKDL